MLKYLIIPAIVITAISLNQPAFSNEQNDTMGQMIAVAREARQIRNESPETRKKKTKTLIERLEKVELPENISAQQKAMKFTLLAELYTVTGDYDASNDCYRKTYTIMPNFGFYRKMVLNMRHKGDSQAAQAVVEEYRKMVSKEYPKPEDAARRQDLVQFVEEGLKEKLPQK